MWEHPEHWGLIRARGKKVRRTPHPAIVTMRENTDHIRVLLYSYYTTIAGWGVLRYRGLRREFSEHKIVIFGGVQMETLNFE